MENTQPSSATAGEATTPAATSAGMALLAAGVPLTLMLDLAVPPHSTEIASAEGGGAAWLRLSA